MSNYIGRMTALKTGLNSHLHKITGIEKDYFSILNKLNY